MKSHDISEQFLQTFDDFYNLLEELHMMTEAKVPFRVSYVDPKDNDLLPINNTDNYLRALQNARPLLRKVMMRSPMFYRHYSSP